MSVILIEIVNMFSSWGLAIVIVALATVYSVGLLILVRRAIGVESLMKNHEVASAKYHVLGVSYAVLLAFVVIVVWEEFREAEGIVHDESQGIFELYQASFDLDDDTGNELRDHLLAYATDVRDTEWPDMRTGQRFDWPTTEQLREIGALVAHNKASALPDLQVMQRAATAFQKMVDYRGQRLWDVTGTLPAIFWWVLVVGGLVTLGFSSFFAVDRLQSQILMAMGLAIVIGLTFFLMVDLSLPYSGGTTISLEPLNRVIGLMEANASSY